MAGYTYEVHDPASIGLDPAKVDELVARARREIDEGVLPAELER